MRSFRLMKPEDIPSVIRLQAECYSPALQEDEPAIRNRLHLAPDSAWIAEDESGACAYLVGYRSALGKVTPLNGLFHLVPTADTLYLHDLAVACRYRGQGVGTALVQLACQKAADEGLAYSALVSVQGSGDFWEGLGYTVWSGLDPAQLSNLKTYPVPASYMARRLRSR